MNLDSPGRLPPALPVLPVLLAGVAAACASEAPPAGDLTITTDTVGGIVHVTNTGTAPEWQLTPVVSIGPKSLSETGAPEEFGRVNSAALGPDEAVFVADGFNDEVRVFGLGGVHRRTFGRNGDGPGEFRSLYSVAHNSRGETGDTLPQLEPPPGPAGFILCQYGGMITLFPIPFGPGLAQHPGPGAVMYSAMTDAYRIAVTGRNGDTLRVIERPLAPEPISDEEWAAGNRDFEELLAERPDAECDPRRPSRPETKSFIQSIFIAPDGKLWVEVIRTAGNRWEFFDTEGRLLGTVPAPARKERAAPSFSADHLITIR